MDSKLKNPGISIKNKKINMIKVVIKQKGK